MLEVALIELVSAGLWRFFVRSESPEASLTDVDGGAFVRHLLFAAPDPAGTVVNRCVTDLWHQVHANQLPTTAAIAHIRLLPEILVADQPASDDAEALFAQSPIAIADAIILAHDIDTSTGDIDETVLTLLLETFLKSLKACHAELDALAPEFAAAAAAASPPPCISAELGAAPEIAAHPAQLTPDPTEISDAPLQRPRPKTTSESSRTLQKIARADALHISVPMLELITVTLINRTRSSDLREADVTAAAAEALALRAELAAISSGKSFDGPGLPGLLTAFDDGRFDAINRTLTAIEEEAVRHTTTTATRDPDFVERATAMRLLRARFHALQGADVQAARQMGSAQRHVARTDHARHWQLARSEARHYEHAAFYGRAPDHLESAARACSTVLANFNAKTPQDLRAEAQSELAHYLIRLGQIEQSSSRFDIAAQLLADAIANLGAATSPTTRLLARIREGDALLGLARLSGATQLFDRAIESYETAIDLLPDITDEPPEESSARRPFDESVTALRARLAIALALRLDADTETNLHEAALETIVDVLPDLAAPHDLSDDAGFSANLLVGLCHRVIAGWLAATGDSAAARRRVAAAAEVLEDACCARLADSIAAEIEPRLVNRPAAATNATDDPHSATPT
jgi:tetratricopeptide (TPR) repeat protein